MLLKFWILLCLIPVALVAHNLLAPRRYWHQLPMVIFLGLALSLASLFFINKSTWVDSDETDAMMAINWIRPVPVESEAYKFISDNFLFIDNSFNKTLVPYDEGTDGDSTAVPVTNRQALLTLVQLLNKQSSLVDLVICDIAFKDGSLRDQALKKEFDSLYNKQKLLLSYNPADQKQKILNFPPAAYGNVREESNDFTFISYSIHAKDQPFSLAYLMYARYSHITHTDILAGNSILVEHKAGHRFVCMNKFLLDFHLTDEQRLYNNLQSQPVGHSNTIQPLAGMPAQNLGFIVTPQGQTILTSEMRQRKLNHLENIVFIGSFNSPDEDVHNTVYGRLHGPTIILNAFYGLIRLQHHVSILIFLFLWLGFILIHFIFIFHMKSELKIHHRSAKPGGRIERGKGRLHGKVFKKGTKLTTWHHVQIFVYEVFRLILLLIAFVLEGGFPFVILAIFIIATWLLSAILLNYTILFVYFLVFEGILRYFGDKKFDFEPKPKPHE